MLLLLESQPLVGEVVYKEVIDDVIAAYWRDFSNHQADFLPAFLTNDVLRLWRTFCVNYEARTQTEPDVKKRKRRLKNYKLKHSRLLTCYSALLYLMAIWQEKRTIAPDDARRLVRFTPTQRIEAISEMTNAGAAPALAEVMRIYAVFLERSNASEADLLTKLGDDAARRDMFESARDFAEAVFTAINDIGRGDEFHRMLVV